MSDQNTAPNPTKWYTAILVLGVYMLRIARTVCPEHLGTRSGSPSVKTYIMTAKYDIGSRLAKRRVLRTIIEKLVAEPELAPTLDVACYDVPEDDRVNFLYAVLGKPILFNNPVKRTGVDTPLTDRIALVKGLLPTVGSTTGTTVWGPGYKAEDWTAKVVDFCQNGRASEPLDCGLSIRSVATAKTRPTETEC